MSGGANNPPKANVDDDKNEIIAHEWITLNALWRRLPPSEEQPEVQKRIKDLLKRIENPELVASSHIHDWLALNEAELAIGSLLTEKELATEYDNLLTIATERKIADLKSYVEYAAKFAEPISNGFDLKARRERYLRLLYQLQAGFVLRRSERRFRRYAARNLFWLGIGFGALFLFTVAAGYHALDGVLTEGCSLFGKPVDGKSCISVAERYYWLLLLVTGVVGAMGACFSRAMALRVYAHGLTFTDFLADYTQRMILLRMIWGATGAVFLFLLLCAGLLGGDVFPSFDAKAPWQAEYAKLLVWSFIAGFSERLIPDLLSKTEGRGAQA